jgi:hypothetical protein
MRNRCSAAARGRTRLAYKADRAEQSPQQLVRQGVARIYGFGSDGCTLLGVGRRGAASLTVFPVRIEFNENDRTGVKN